MKHILFLVFLCLGVQLNASDKHEHLTDLLHSFGDNGEYAKMDSVYKLITREKHYREDKLYALNNDLDYARFLNQKGDYAKAYGLLTQTREKASATENLSEKDSLYIHLQGIKAISTYEIAYGQWQNNQLPEARNTAAEAIKLLEQLKDSVNLAEAYNLSGVIHRRLFMFDNAISLYEKALVLTESLKNYNLAAIIVSNISILYNEVGKNEEAIQVSRKMFAYPQTDTQTLDYRIAQVNKLCNHAILLANNHMLRNALDTLQLANRELQPEMPDGLKLLAYTQYGRVLRDLGKPSQALQYFQKAMSYKATTFNQANIANLEYLYGYMLFHDTDSLAQARHHVMKAVEFARKYPSGLLPKALLALAEIEAKRHENQLSYQLVLEAYKASEELNNQYFHNRLSGFQAELDLKEKDLQIAGINEKRAADRAAYLARTYTIGGILIVMVLLLVILTISMHKRKIAFNLKQLKLQKEIKEKEMQSQLLLTDMHKKMTEQYICGLEDSNNRISKELHDGVCNDLLSIEIKMQQTGTLSLSTQLYQVREELRNLSHQLATPVFNNFSLYQVLTLYAEKLKSLKNIHVECYIEESIKQLSLPPEHIQQVYRILQEIASNLIKHADAKNAYVTASYESGKVNLIFEDDGKGFSTTHPVKESSGLGLKNIQERCAQLQGGCEITSKEQHGTVIHFWFPA